jgi:methyl-accepting chemotaxis protein
MTAILFTMHYFEKNLTVEFQKRLRNNYEGIEIEMEEMFDRLKVMSKKNAEDDEVIKATLEKKEESLNPTVSYLLKLELLDEITVFDYEGNLLSKALNPALKKIKKTYAEDDDPDLDEDKSKQAEAAGTIESKLPKSLVGRLMTREDMVIKSIDSDYGLRIDAFNVIKEAGFSKVIGIMRNTFFIDERFCLKYKRKTGVDLMIISPEVTASSLDEIYLQGADFSDIYESVESEGHYLGEELINNIKYEFLVNPLKSEEAMMNSGMVFFLSKEDFLKSVNNMKLTITLIGLTIFILVFVFSVYSTKFITDPINTVLNKLREISKGEGDLTERIFVDSKNEIGKLVEWFNKFMDNMQEIVTSINSVSTTLESSSQDILGKMKKITDGGSSQLELVAATLGSIEEMDGSVKNIAEAANELSGSAEKTSSAVLETDASVKELSKNSETLSSSVESAAMSISEMVASIKQVDNHAAELNMITTDTQESMKKIEESIHNIEDNANQTVKLSEQSIEDASTGTTSVIETIKGINLIKDSVDKSSLVIETLGKKIASIDDILDVIDNVAEQTNLLALNAAIIAAQAGERGKGFAIVADEIKDLADRTASSTKEIANIIIAVQKESKNAIEVMRVSSENVTKSVNLSKDAGGALEKILSNAEESTNRVKDIASATVMQTNKTSEVMKSMIEVSGMVNQISSATKEQSVGSSMILKATEDIKEIAYQLKTAVREQTYASKDISAEIMNVSQMVKQINKAIIIQQKQSEAALNAFRTIKDNGQDNQRILDDLGNIVDVLVDTSEDTSAVLSKETGRFKV